MVVIIWNWDIWETSVFLFSSHSLFHIPYSHSHSHSHLEKQTDNRGTKAFFSQLFQQLKGKAPSMWRIPPNARAFKVTVAGEYGDDYGGPYRSRYEYFVLCWVMLYSPFLVCSVCLFCLSVCLSV